MMVIKWILKIGGAFVVFEGTALLLTGIHPVNFWILLGAVVFLVCGAGLIFKGYKKEKTKEVNADDDKVH